MIDMTLCNISNSSFIFIILLFILTMLSAFFSSTEIAFFSLSTSRIRAWRNSQDKRKVVVANLLRQSRHLLVLIFMLNTIVNVLLQNVSSNLFESTEWGLFGKIVIPLILILVFGELLPKWVGMVKNESFALFASYFYPFMSTILSPFQRVITSLSELLSRLFFFFLKPEPPLTADELETIIHGAVEDGVLKTHEASLITNWLELNNKTALDVMIPRSEISTIHIEEVVHHTHEQVTNTIRKSAKEKRDTTHINSTGLIIGHANDAPEGFLLYSDIFSIQKIVSQNKATPIFQRQIAFRAKQQLFFVPETMKVRKLIQELEERKSSVACVVDEHDMVLGYVFRSQLLHRLSTTDGLLYDPVKMRTHTAGIQATNNSSLIASGSLSLEAVNAFFGCHLTSTYRSTTIGGWLIEQLDMLPAVGTKYEYNHILFRVLASDATKIKKIFIYKKRVIVRDIQNTLVI